jgi:multidrug efflux pump
MKYFDADHRHLTVTLMCVFVPRILHSGITRQHPSPVCSDDCGLDLFLGGRSLTLSPAVPPLLLKKKSEQHDPLTLILNLFLGWFFKLFNWGFNLSSSLYAGLVGWYAT